MCRLNESVSSEIDSSGHNKAQQYFLPTNIMLHALNPSCRLLSSIVFYTLLLLTKLTTLLPNQGLETSSVTAVLFTRRHSGPKPIIDTSSVSVVLITCKHSATHHISITLPTYCQLLLCILA